MLRTAFVGMGWAGSRQVQGALELGRRIEVYSLVDNDAQHLAQTAKDLGVTRVETHYAAALADLDVDAVSICLPHRLHVDVAVAAAEAGKHILVEKPMAMNVDEATRMIDAASDAGVVLYVAESAVYTPMARYLRHVVESGDPIGELTLASVISGFRGTDYGYPGRRSWLSTPAEGGSGVWLLNGIHTVAQMRYILGDVATVYAREHKASSFRRRDLEATVSAMLTLNSGVSVYLTQSAETRVTGTLRGYVLHGDRGSVRASENGYQLFEDGSAEPPLIAYEPQHLSSYALELEAFADCIERGIAGPTTGESERRSLAVVQAGLESIASGQPVDMADRFGDI